MASILNLGPYDRLSRLCTNTSLATSRSSSPSLRSLGTVCHKRLRQFSVTSHISATSSVPINTDCANSPSRSRSSDIGQISSQGRTASACSAPPYRKHVLSETSDNTLAHSQGLAPRTLDAREHIEVQLQALRDTSTSSVSDDEVWHDSLKSPLSPSAELVTNLVVAQHGALLEHKPSHSWMRRLRRQRSSIRPAGVDDGSDRQTITNEGFGMGTCGSRKHTRSTSGSEESSLNFLSLVKSASVTIASSSVTSLRNAIKASPRSPYTPASDSRSSNRIRRSMDSDRSVSISSHDIAAHKRAFLRRAKLHEILATERGYLADIRALSHVRVSVR